MFSFLFDAWGTLLLGLLLYTWLYRKYAWPRLVVQLRRLPGSAEVEGAFRNANDAVVRTVVSQWDSVCGKPPVQRKREPQPEQGKQAPVPRQPAARRTAPHGWSLPKVLGKIPVREFAGKVTTLITPRKLRSKAPKFDVAVSPLFPGCKVEENRQSLQDQLLGKKGRACVTRTRDLQEEQLKQRPRQDQGLEGDMSKQCKEQQKQQQDHQQQMEEQIHRHQLLLQQQSEKMLHMEKEQEQKLLEQEKQYQQRLEQERLQQQRILQEQQQQLVREHKRLLQEQQQQQQQQQQLQQQQQQQQEQQLQQQLQQQQQQQLQQQLQQQQQQQLQQQQQHMQMQMQMQQQQQEVKHQGSVFGETPAFFGAPPQQQQQQQSFFGAPPQQQQQQPSFEFGTRNPLPEPQQQPTSLFGTTDAQRQQHPFGAGDTPGLAGFGTGGRQQMLRRREGFGMDLQESNGFGRRAGDMLPVEQNPFRGVRLAEAVDHERELEEVAGVHRGQRVHDVLIRATPAERPGRQAAGMRRPAVFGSRQEPALPVRSDKFEKKREERKNASIRFAAHEDRPPLPLTRSTSAGGVARRPLQRNPAFFGSSARPPALSPPARPFGSSSSSDFVVVKPQAKPGVIEVSFDKPSAGPRGKQPPARLLQRLQNKVAVPSTTRTTTRSVPSAPLRARAPPRPKVEDAIYTDGPLARTPVALSRRIDSMRTPPADDDSMNVSMNNTFAFAPTGGFNCDLVDSPRPLI